MRTRLELATPGVTGNPTKAKVLNFQYVNELKNPVTRLSHSLICVNLCHKYGNYLWDFAILATSFYSFYNQIVL